MSMTPLAVSSLRHGERGHATDTGVNTPWCQRISDEAIAQVPLRIGHHQASGIKRAQAVFPDGVCHDVAARVQRPLGEMDLPIHEIASRRRN
jgi:hypothetical protein